MKQIHKRFSSDTSPDPDPGTTQLLLEGFTWMTHRTLKFNSPAADCLISPHVYALRHLLPELI